MLSSLLPPPKMSKGKKAKRKKVALTPDVLKKQEAKVVIKPVWEKDKGFWHWTGYPSQMGHHPLCQMALLHLAAVAKCLLWWTCSPRPWTAKQLLNCLSWPTSTDQRQSKRSRSLLAGLRKRIPAKVLSPPKGLVTCPSSRG